MKSNLHLKLVFALLLALLAAGVMFVSMPAYAQTSPPPQTETGKYLLIGTTSNDIAKGVNVQNGDLGADHIMLSDEINDNVDFDNQDVFGGGPSSGAPKNWSEGDNSPFYGVFPGGTADYLHATSQLNTTVTAANVFEGTDWTGNVALTSPNAKFDMSNVEVYADLGVLAASASPVSSVSNSKYFADGVVPNPGNNPGNGQPLPPNGLTASATTQMAALRGQLDAWEAFIRDLAPEVTLGDSDLDPGDSGGINNERLWAINVDPYDTNNDGIAVIDLNFPGTDLNITNSNIVIESANNTFAIFRIRGGSNLVLNQSTIVLGKGYTGGVRSAPVDFLGAVIVKMTGYSNGQGGWNAGEPGNSGDTVLSFNDTVLNGVAFWDLIIFGNGSNNNPSGSPVGNANFDNGTTELNINNGQGCSQFISPKINFNNVRWNRCAVTAERSGAIGNYVWVDENSDGYQDAGEPGIPNVRVDLKSCTTGAILATTYTDAQGGYLFDNLAAGTYCVDVDESTLPAGMVQTPYTLSNSDFGNQNHSGNGYQVVLPAGGENLTADFGYNFNSTVCVDDPANPLCTETPPTAALGDRVWIDADGDGAQDPEEAGVANACVELFTAGDDGIFGTGDNESQGTQTTDATGFYLFDGLDPDAYVVKMCASNFLPGGPLDGYTQTGDPDHFGTSGSNNDNQTTMPVVLGPGDVFLNADFGYQPPASQNNSIGNKVWFDNDADGVGPSGNGAAPGDDDTEKGIPGVTVALIKDVNGDGIWQATEPIIATDTTDATGDYLFPGLPDGSYLVWVNDTDNVLGDKTPTYDKDGGAAPGGSGAPVGVASSTVLGLSSSLNLGVGNPNPASDLTQDFGYTAPGQTPARGLIGDTVWFDANNSGGATQDAGEPGIEGVLMELLNSGGAVIATTTTDENGNYYFGGLALDDGVGAAGADYTVRVAASNFAPGAVLEGMSNTYDPDGTTPVGTGATVTLTTVNKINLLQDFSYTGTTGAFGSIGNRVWQDLNANGVYEPALGETALVGVTLDLYRDLNGNGTVDPGEPKINSQTTDASGLYLFARLPLVGGGDADPEAEYVVDVTDVAGKVFGWWHSLGSQDASSNGGNDAADNSKVDPFAVEIGTGAGGQPVANNLNVDFGYYVKPAALGNFVWEDLNEDGIQDPGEPGIDDVEVTLVITWPNGDTTTLKTFTGDDPSTLAVEALAVEAGWYSFGNLLLDEDYRVGSATSTLGVNQPVHELSVVAPAGMVPSEVNVRPDGTQFNDSDDPDGTIGVPKQGLTDVSFSQDDKTPASYDFGFYDETSLDSAPRDWGDLPSGYPTLLADDGARHVASTRLYLGLCIDTEGNGQPSAQADGDNTSFGVVLRSNCSNTNDEDGVSKATAINGGSWAVGAVNANQGGGLQIVIGAGTGVPQVFMDFTDDANYTLSPVTLYYDHDNTSTPVVAYAGTPLPAGIYTFYFDIPAGVTNTTPIPTRVRLSATGGLGPTGLAPRGEVEDYIFEIGTPLAVNLAAFEATVQGNHVLVAWETVSEASNAGFNLYRSLTADGERTLLGFTASSAPGSTQGASYSYDDFDVTAGQGYWYWLEDIDLSGAATLHGPVSVVFQAPTAVTLDGLSAETSASNGAAPFWVALAALLMAAAATFLVIRRRVTS